MSISKRYIKNGTECKVTFKITKKESNNAQTVNLVGDFNGWDLNAAPMSRLKSGDFTVTLTLHAGKIYEFRYWLDNNIWENDWTADGYRPSPYEGTENSFIDI